MNDSDIELGIEKERQAYADLDKAIGNLCNTIRDYYGYFWHHGDGNGGAIIMRIAQAFDRYGFTDFNISILTGSVNPEAKSRAMRTAVLERDAYRCKYCGDWHDLQIDHIKPVSKGGETKMDNLQTLCQRCNSEKGAKWG